MRTFIQFLSEAHKPISLQYRNGWDDTVYAFKNWGEGRPDKKTPKQWAIEMYEKLSKMNDPDDYVKGALGAFDIFIKQGNVDYIGTSIGRYGDKGEDLPSPFSPN